MRTSLSSCLLAGVLLAGTAIAEPTQTVDWYQKHPSERATLLRECRNNPGELGDTPNCVNAEKAEAKEQIAKHGFYLRPMTKKELGPTPWRWDNPANPPPFTQRKSPHGE